LLTRFRRDKSTGSDPVALVEGSGVLVAGPQLAIESVVSALTDFHSVRSFRAPAHAVVAATSTLPPKALAQEYVRLSPASWELLRQHGAVPGDDGYFRMFVHDNAKKIAGQLQWEKVSLGAEQALSLQMAAISLALQAAILEVQQSVERVEAKLDQVTKLLRAERRGNALGDHRTLSTLGERVRANGRISGADWDSVASLGPEINRDLEGLRAHLRSLLERDKPTRLTWGRAEEVQQLLEESWLAETLALLAVTEHNLALWYELRLARVKEHEPRYLADTIADARRQLDTQRAQDQHLLDALVAFATEVADPRVLDGLDPLNAGRLVRARAELDQLVQWFAEQRVLDASPLDEEAFPRFHESAHHLWKVSSQGLANTLNWARRRLGRPQPTDQSALPTPDENPRG
jgi:hypothetical protein